MLNQQLAGKLPEKLRVYDSQGRIPKRETVVIGLDQPFKTPSLMHL
jgi:hypothetical protein